MDEQEQGEEGEVQEGRHAQHATAARAAAQLVPPSKQEQLQSEDEEGQQDVCIC